jgi:hypothetical protein
MTRDIIFTIGVTLAAVGLWMAWPPASLIAVGSGMAWSAWRLSR